MSGVFAEARPASSEPLESKYTIQEAAPLVSMTPGALRVYLCRHPEFAKPRYREAPRQHASRRKRLLTESEVRAIAERRVK